MKPPIFEYHRPHSLQEALSLMEKLENSKVIAGGQSLMPMLNLRLTFPSNLIDLNSIEELSGISTSDDQVTINAMTRQREIEFSKIIRQRIPLMADGILNVGHRQTRNRGTIGGSLCHQDSVAELPLIALAHDAVLGIASLRGIREIGIAEFCTGFMSTSLEDGEILVFVKIKHWPQGHGWSFIEFARRDGDFAIVSAAVLVTTTGDGTISRVSVALGGVGPYPLRVSKAEDLLLGRYPTNKLIGQAAACCAELQPFDDPNIPAWYRKQLAHELSFKAIKEAIERSA